MLPQAVGVPAEQFPPIVDGEFDAKQFVGRVAFTAPGAKLPTVPVETLQVNQASCQASMSCLLHANDAIDPFDQAAGTPACLKQAADLVHDGAKRFVTSYPQAQNS